MPAFHWFKDDKLYCLPLKGPEPHAIEISDGYSQWTLGPGADFDLTDELRTPGSNPADYSYVVAVDSLTGPGPGDPGLPMEIGGDRRAHPGACSGGPLPAPETSMVSRLPVRAISIPPEDHRVPVAPGYAPPAGLDPDATVIVAIIDDGINVAHERFRTIAGGEIGSRVDFAWVQDGPAAQDGTTVAFGRELSRGEIEAAIQTFGTDEDAILEALSLVGDPLLPYRPSVLRFRRSHGTFVADLAAGGDPADAGGLNRRIVAVQLPSLATQDTSGASLIAAIFESLRYVFDRALIMSRAVGIALPVVVNFSFAFGGGGRNSAHILERAMVIRAHDYRQRVAAEGLAGAAEVPVEFCLPAGNMALAQGHACTPVTEAAAEQRLSVSLRVQPDDRTSSYVEVWLPKEATEAAMAIVSPNGNRKRFKLKLGHTRAWVLACADPDDDEQPDRQTVVARVKTDKPNLLPPGANGPAAQFHRVLLALAPSLVLDKPRPGLPAGGWTLEVEATVPAGGRIEAWIQRDETILGMGQRGRQAYFEDPAYTDSEWDRMGDIAVADTSDSPIRRDGTLSGIATARTDLILGEPDTRIGTTVAGGYRWRSGAAAIYSAAGSQTVRLPGVMAATDTSRMLPGVLAAGSLSGTQVALTGTSMAAPQVARLFADTLAALPPAGRGAFDRAAVLAGAEETVPPRPDATHPELASNDRIRVERVETGLLGVAGALMENVARATGPSGTLPG